MAIAPSRAACPLQHHFRARYKFPSMVTHYASWEYRVAVTKLRLPKCKGKPAPSRNSRQ